MNEEQFRRKIRELAALYRWQAYHTHRSDRSDAGWPDEVLSKPGRVIFVELKKEDGRIRKDQAVWLRLLEAAGQEVALWRPSDLPTVIRVLGPRQERARLPENFGGNTVLTWEKDRYKL